jgi:hypothetical protein
VGKAHPTSFEPSALSLEPLLFTVSFSIHLAVFLASGPARVKLQKKGFRCLVSGVSIASARGCVYLKLDVSSFFLD